MPDAVNHAWNAPAPNSINYAPAPAPAGGMVGGAMYSSAVPAPAPAPRVDQGVIGGAMAPTPTVSGTNTAGHVTNVDRNQFANTTPASSATAGQASGEGYDAAQANVNHWNVTDDQTVQGQVAKIISSDSELSQQARTQAAQTAAQRGLINSSMAVQAGQAAVLNAALPIAQQDATTYGSAAKSNTEYDNANQQFNTSARNNASEFSAGARNTASLQNANLATDVSKQNSAATNALQSQQIDNTAKAEFQNAAAANDASKFDAQTGLQAALANQDVAVKQSAQQYDAGVKAAMQDADAETRVQLQQIDATTRTQLADIEARYKNQLQTSTSMSQTYQSMIDGITRVMMDKDMDAAAKQAAITNLTTLYNGALDVQQNISGLELGTLLSPDAFQASDGKAVTDQKAAAAKTAEEQAQYQEVRNNLTPGRQAPDNSMENQPGITIGGHG